MALVSGTRIGPYELVAQIGAGGMGEVYRARDTKLQRDVAVKILPHAFLADRDRVLRIEREAQMLAALNHTNVAQVFGVLDEPPAVVMELVAGRGLDELISTPGGSARRAGLPLAECLSIARQIAEALEAAHECGIIHRDLKPANIRVREDGVVKVLDFGLAKAMPSTAITQGSSSTFMSPAATQVGVVLGTAAYMAPEQAKGKPVDRRVDVSAGIPHSPMVWDLPTGTVRVFDVPGPHNQLPFAVAGWLPDARGFLFASGRGLVLVDAASGKATPVAAPENGTRYRLSGDGRMLYTERDVLDADIWLLEERDSK